MGTFGRAQRLLAILIACSMSWHGLATSAAATPDSAASSQQADAFSEPFELPASSLSEGGVYKKWQELGYRLDDERVQLALCDGDRDRCASPAALQFLAIVDKARVHDGRARIGEINRAINLAIRPMSDLAQYGAIDVWSPPLVTFYRGAGDCEDYAIAKYVALRQAGISPDDLRIVIMRDTIRGESHAVASARLEGRWLILDNRRMAMVEDISVRNYRPMFVIDKSGVMKYGDPPLLAAQDAFSY